MGYRPVNDPYRNLQVGYLITNSHSKKEKKKAKAKSNPAEHLQRKKKTLYRSTLYVEKKKKKKKKAKSQTTVQILNLFFGSMCTVQFPQHKKKKEFKAR